MPSRRDDDNGAIGLILAGGRATRLFPEGGDKGLLDLCGEPMLARVIARFAPQARQLVLSANGDPLRFASFGLPVVADEIGEGPLAGILAGMRWASSNAPDAPWIATVSTDMPFLPLDLVTRLRERLEGKPGAIALGASSGGTHYVAGLWPVALADGLAATLAGGERRVGAWTSRHDTAVVNFPAVAAGDRSIDPFFNVNGPSDLAEARRLIVTKWEGE